MMRRYRLMADQGVRDLDSYNKTVRSDPDKKPMEQIVVVIDELADLMLVAAKEVEESICRIAQMGRASGIHLVIATQRPSADVITGLMKANIPSRIAFAVSSAMESRIILDTQGCGKARRQGRYALRPARAGQAQARAGLLHLRRGGAERRCRRQAAGRERLFAGGHGADRKTRRAGRQGRHLRERVRRGQRVRRGRAAAGRR